MEVSLKNQVALITGSSSGIGAAIAQSMAESGATLLSIIRLQVRWKKQMQSSKTLQIKAEKEWFINVMFPRKMR